MTPREFLKTTSAYFTSQEASCILKRTPIETAKVLHRWVKQGWIYRASRGLYAAVPLVASESSSLDNPLGIVPALIGEEGYVCGWSALSHWGLTEQIFRDLSLASYNTKRLKKRTLDQGHVFLFPAYPIPLRALTKLWLGDQRVFISDIHQTLMDTLIHPTWGAGMLHVIDCLKNYIHHEACSWDLLLSHAQNAHVKGVFFKKLGFLLEQLGGPQTVIETCQKQITQGFTPLDPHHAQGRFCLRWNLIVPEHLKI